MSGLILSQLIEDYSIITMHGSREIYVENFKSLLDISKERIKIRALKEILIIEGQSLLIEYMNSCDIKITGCIKEVKISEVME